MVWYWHMSKETKPNQLQEFNIKIKGSKKHLVSPGSYIAKNSGGPSVHSENVSLSWTRAHSLMQILIPVSYITLLSFTPSNLDKTKQLVHKIHAQCVFLTGYLNGSGWSPEFQVKVLTRQEARNEHSMKLSRDKSEPQYHDVLEPSVQSNYIALAFVF